jgi:Fe-S oxidoreductase
LKKNDKKPSQRIDCPSQEVDPENFLNNDQIYDLLAKKDDFIFSQEDELKLLDCIHCNACETSEERAQLNRKFLEDGNEIRDLDRMIDNFNDHRTPYNYGKMRIKPPEGIPKESETLYYMGCLSTIRIPRYTEDSIRYLLKRNVDFTILEQEICCGYPFYVSGAMKEYEEAKKENLAIFEKFKKVICTCPACYFMFKEHYKDKTDIEFVYITDYLIPSETKRDGLVGIQHLCQLMYRGVPGVEEDFDQIYRDSGYTVKDIPHKCCGGGIGYMHRLEVIDAIAKLRIEDFKDVEYYTSYCPACWWILYYFGKKIKIHRKLKNPFELLM